MKNEDKGKNKGKLKYIGVVVVVVFLAGIYLASATTVITDIQMTLEKVGVGNTRIGGGFIEVDDSSGSPIFCVNSTSGNVGIGTADPQGLLQVGEGCFVVTFPGNDVGVSDVPSELTPDAKLEITTGTTKDFLMLSSTANADGDRFIVKNDGRVGIGTTNPGNYKLNVQGGSDNAIYGETSGAAPGKFAVYGYNSGNGDAVRGYCTFTGCYGVYGENGAAGIGVYGKGGINGEGVRGETSGPAGKAVHGKNTGGFGGYFEGKGYFSDSVGIGTTEPNPNAKLEVKGGRVHITDDYPILMLDNEGGTGPDIWIASSNFNPSAGDFMIYQASPSPTKRILSYYLSGPKLALMADGGNVGIGTTDPKTTLDVDGLIRTRAGPKGICNADLAGAIAYEVSGGVGDFWGCKQTSPTIFAWVQLS